MGTITSLIKSSAKNSMSQLKSYDVKGKINSALDMSGIDLKIPDKIDMPDTIKNFKPNFTVNELKLPAGIDSGLSPIAAKLASGIKLPSEIGGVPLPELPDLSSVTSEVNSFISGMGIDTNKLGIRSVDEILKEPDLSALKAVQFETPKVADIPDLTASMEGLNIGDVQKQIDEITGEMPGMESIDISQYF